MTTENTVSTDAVSDYDLIMTNERNGYSIFDADYTPTPEVIALVNQVFDHIEVDPKSWNQRNYGSMFSDTNCFFGLLIRISGIDPHEHNKMGYNGFGIDTGMALLNLGTSYEDRLNYYDRAEYISYFRSAYCEDNPTLDEMQERVSIALNHDFRKPKNETKAFNDPTVDCCERDAADCDCPDKPILPTLTVGENGPYPQPYNEV